MTSSRRATRLALVGLVGLAAFALSAAPTAASAADAGGAIGVRLVEAPTSAAGDPRAQLYVVDHLAPGTVIHRRIEVSTTAPAAQIRLYPGAAEITDGAFLGGEGDSPNELSTWTSVSPGDVELTADQTATAEVTIAVPADAAPGERYGVVWAETRSGSASGVTEVNRVGIRLYVSVGPGGAPAADFTIDSMTAQRSSDGSAAVLALVHNTGGRALDLSGTLDLQAVSGALHAGPYPADLGITLGIGQSRAVTIPVTDDVPAGPWGAVVTLRSGLVERSARAQLTFPDAGTAAPVPVGPVTSGRSWVLWAALAVGGLVLLIAVMLLTRPRRRRAVTGAPAAASVE